MEERAADWLRNMTTKEMCLMMEKGDLCGRGIIRCPDRVSGYVGIHGRDLCEGEKKP